MSDQPRRRASQSEPRDGADRDGRGWAADDTGAGPLRTRRDPRSVSGDSVRPPSSQPAWSNRDPSDRRRTGRYGTPPSDLPAADLPGDAPGWMGRRGDGSGDDGYRVSPRPQGDRYATGLARDEADDRSPGKADRPSSWPDERQQRPTRRYEDDAEDRRFSARYSDRQRPARAPRPGRPVSVALGDPLCQRFMVVLLLAVAALWVLVTLQRGDLEAPLVLRLDADGLPETVTGAGGIWRVPFVGTMLAIMSVGVALLIAGRDLFAGRFVLGMGVAVQALMLVAAVTLLW